MVPAVMGVIAGKLWRKRIVITYHGGEAKEYFAKHVGFVKRWLGRANQVIVLSGFLKEVFDQYNIPCVVIPNIVVLQPQQKRTRDIGPKFISIRHLEPLYNIPCILRAYEQVLKVYPDATLDILGRGSQREELEAYVEEHQLTDITFVGQVPNQQIYDYLAKADIMLSAPKIDNMPVSLLEAMNAGLLVISSRVGGVPYMIEEYDMAIGNGQWAIDKETNSQSPNSLIASPDRLIASSPNRLMRPTGLLFESGNADELAEKMIWALEHTEEANNMILAAQKEVQKYSWENVKLLLMKVYCS
jgi:glycosyltransferase involved in cell wall biosynthesis